MDLLQDTRKGSGLYHREQGWGVVFWVSGDQEIRMALHCRDHLNSIFKIFIIQIKSLFNGLMINPGNV